MKKLFYLIGAILLIGTTSCKKSWTCNCTETINDNGTISTSTYSVELTTYRKDLAKTECSANTTSTSSYGYSTTVSCQLK